MHAFRLGKAQRATNQPLDPGPEIDVFALDFLRVLLAYVMLLDIDMPLIGPPSVGVIFWAPFKFRLTVSMPPLVGVRW
jgi:hypothetical protein